MNEQTSEETDTLVDHLSPYAVASTLLAPCHREDGSLDAVLVAAVLTDLVGATMHLEHEIARMKRSAAQATLLTVEVGSLSLDKLLPLMKAKTQ